MNRTGIVCLLVGLLAATAQARSTRALQELDLSQIDLSKIPVLPALGLMPTGVELPPLSEFLPPLDSINLPPLNEFLTQVGLPTWEEMNLPPLSEFMKPVFDPQAVELPTLNDLLKQANETFVATLKDIVGDIPLPPGVKLPELKLPPLPNVDLSKIKLPDIDTTKLPQLPSLDKLIDILNSIQSGKMPDLSGIPGLENLKLPDNLPPLQDVMNALAPLADLVGKLSQLDLSKIDLATILNGGGNLNLPALAEVLKALPDLPKNLPAFGEIAKVVVGMLGKASSGRALLTADIDINDLLPQGDMVPLMQ